jgi:hypothetical protein
VSSFPSTERCALVRISQKPPSSRQCAAYCQHACRSRQVLVGPGQHRTGGLAHNGFVYATRDFEQRQCHNVKIPVQFGPLMSRLQCPEGCQPQKIHARLQTNDAEGLYCTFEIQSMRLEPTKGPTSHRKIAISITGASLSPVDVTSAPGEKSPGIVLGCTNHRCLVSLPSMASIRPMKTLFCLYSIYRIEFIALSAQYCEGWG